MTQSTFSHTTGGMETPPAPKAMAFPDLAEIKRLSKGVAHFRLTELAC